MRVGDLVYCASIMYGETVIGIVVKWLPNAKSWPDAQPGGWEVLYDCQLDTVFECEMEIVNESR